MMGTATGRLERDSDGKGNGTRERGGVYGFVRIAAEKRWHQLGEMNGKVVPTIYR